MATIYMDPRHKAGSLSDAAPTAFKNYGEDEIIFYPTFKYDVGTQVRFFVFFVYDSDDPIMHADFFAWLKYSLPAWIIACLSAYVLYIYPY